MAESKKSRSEVVKVCGWRTHICLTLRRSQQWVEFAVPNTDVEAGNPRFGCELPTCTWSWGPVEKWNMKPGMTNVTLWIPTQLTWCAYMVGDILSRILASCRALGLTTIAIDECVPGRAGLAAYGNPNSWYMLYTPKDHFPDSKREEHSK